MKKNTLLKRIQAVLTASTLMMGVFLTPGPVGAKEVRDEAVAEELNTEEPETEATVPETETEEPQTETEEKETETEEPQKEERAESSGLAYKIVIDGNPNMGIGATQQLTATVYAEDGTLATVQTVKWESGNTAVATVDQTGRVKPIKYGTVSIFAEATDNSGVREEFKITIGTIKVNSIIVKYEDRNMVQGGANQTLTVDILPEDAANKDVTWSSNASSVAKVDQVGVVTPVGPGLATITATAKDGSGVMGSVIINVWPKMMKMNKPVRVNEKTREVKLSWETIPTGTYYMLQWCKNKNFEASMKKVYKQKITKPSTSSYTVKVAKDGKWFFRICCVKEVPGADGQMVKLEGAWSKPKKLKVKLKTS